MKKMRFCESCGAYTLLPSHCSKDTVSAHPSKFNPNDRHGKHRRRARYGV